MSLPGPTQISVQNFTAVRCAIVEFMTYTRYDASRLFSRLIVTPGTPSTRKHVHCTVHNIAVEGRASYCHDMMTILLMRNNANTVLSSNLLLHLFISVFRALFTDGVRSAIGNILTFVDLSFRL